MAWQLIYTSAPRLLEAGRTGFGTVARHRAVSGMLASTVERFSQFARLPGHDPRRVVHTYRVLTVAGASYHVFTRLRDAGSDYTGRTNHLAQHVIAEAREIRALAASGLTPADVLLAIPWRESWTEGPRFLDPSEEIDLSNFPQAASSAWAAITGNPASARLLGTPQALKGCYLILPPEARALELFREAMIEAPQGGWQTSLTTSLEPNDEVGDFRWIGLPFDSPLRTQAEVSNRLLLDLTQPAKLPAPPEPPAKVPLPEPERAAPVTTHPPAEIRSPKKVTLGRPPASTAPVSQMGGWSPEPVTTSSKKKTNTVLMAFVAVSLLSASIAGFFMWRHFTTTHEHATFQDQIKEVWDKHGLVLKNTRKSLGDEPDLEKGRALLGSLDAYVRGLLQVLKNADLKGSLPTPEDTKNLPDFEDLKNAFNHWKQIHAEASASSASKASELLHTYDEWLEKRKESWSNLSAQIKKIGSLPDVDQGTRAKFVNDAKELLRKKPQDKLDISTWEKFNERLGKDSEIAEWLRIWAELDGGSKVQVAQNAQRNGSLPTWLTAEAQKVLAAHDKALAEKTEAERKSMQDKAAKTADTPKHKIEDADSLDGTHPIFIFNSTDEATKTTKEGIDKAEKLPFKDEKDKEAHPKELHLYVGGWADRNPIGEARQGSKTGELIEWVEHLESSKTRWIYGEFKAQQNKSDLLEFDEAGAMTRLPARAKDGLRIVARKNDDEKSVLFDVRIIPAASPPTKPVASPPTKPVLWQTVTGTSLIESTTIKLHGIRHVLSRLKWPGGQPTYQLSQEGAPHGQNDVEIQLADEEPCVVKPPSGFEQQVAEWNTEVQKLNKDIEDLNTAIQKCDQDLAENETKNLAKNQKDQNRARIDTSKSKKVIARNGKQEALGTLQNEKPTFELKPGTYLLRGNNTVVCRLVVTSASDQSDSSTKKQ